MAFTSDEAFALLRNALANHRLAHAYLISGPIGSGKRRLATRLTELLIEGVESLQHPDVHVIEPESKSRRILTEQIRELEQALHMRSFFGGRKVGIIFDADRLQPQAANAFLKTLEEPPAHSHLLLISSQPDQLLETITSRCLEVPLRSTEAAERSPLQQRLVGLLRDFTNRPEAKIAGAFGLAREFLQCLGTARAAIQEQADAEFKADEVHYKQTSDAKAWLDTREDYFKAAIEARYQRERATLLETLGQWWADVLRQQHGAAVLEFPEFAADTAALASQLSTPQLLQKNAALEQLRENLGRSGVQEQLAIECAFLAAFAA
jgi:DNA polymerase-3 subunit delta'